MSPRVTLIRGDGIGPEVVEAVLTVLEAAGADVEWEEQAAGAAVAGEGGEPLPEAVVASIRANGVALKGPVTTPIGSGFPSINVRLRKALDLFVNLRPVRSLPGVPCLYDDVDLVVVRENTQGLYSGIEHEVIPGVIESLKIVTAAASERIARYAFELARDQERSKVTAVHKANIMKMSDGLFLQCFRRVASDFPTLEADERIVDNMAMQLVMYPQRFDVLVLPNLYGDIVSDLCAGLVGGLGVVPGANLGDGCAVFEAVHGSAPDIAGRDLANPTALLLSAAMMLDHLGQEEAARRVRRGIDDLFGRGVSTRDIGGELGTEQFAKELAAAVRAD